MKKNREFTQNANSQKEYVIDWDKVKSIKDVMVILKGLDLVFYEGYPQMEKLKPLLKLKAE